MSWQSGDESLFVPRPSAASAAGGEAQGPDTSRAPAPSDKTGVACTTIVSTPDPSPPSSPKGRPEGTELLAGLSVDRTSGSKGIGFVPGADEASRDCINNIAASEMGGSSLSNLSEYDMLDEVSSKESIGVEDLPSGTDDSDDEVVSGAEDESGLVPNSENAVSRNQVGADLASTLAMMSSMDTLPSMTDEGDEGRSHNIEGDVKDQAGTDLSLGVAKVDAAVVPSDEDDKRNLFGVLCPGVVPQTNDANTLRAPGVDDELGVRHLDLIECATKCNNEELSRNNSGSTADTDIPGKYSFAIALAKVKGGIQGHIRLLIASVGVSAGRLLNGCTKLGSVLSRNALCESTTSAAEDGSGTNATIRNDNSATTWNIIPDGISSHVANAISSLVVKTKKFVSSLNAIRIRNFVASVMVFVFLWHFFMGKKIIAEERSTLDPLICVSSKDSSFTSVPLWELDLSPTLSKTSEKVSLTEQPHDDHRCFATHTSSFDSIPLWQLHLSSASFERSSAEPYADHRCFATHTSSFDSIPKWEYHLSLASFDWFDQSSAMELLLSKQPLDGGGPANFRIYFVVLAAMIFSVALIFKRAFWIEASTKAQSDRETASPESAPPAHSVTNGEGSTPIFPTTSPPVGSPQAVVLWSDAAKKRNKELLNCEENNLQGRADAALANPEFTRKDDLESENMCEELQTLQSENKDLRKENDCLLQELNQIIPQSKSTSEKMAKLAEEKNCLTRDTNQRIAQLMLQVHGLMEEKERLTEENRKLMEDKGHHKERADSVERRHATLEQEMTILQAQYTSLEQSMSGLEAHSASLIEDIIRSV